MLLTTSLITLLILRHLLWIKDFHNALFWAFCLQWLAINVKVFYSLFTGVDFESLTDFPDHIYYAFFSSNAGIVVFASGIKLMLPKSISDIRISHNDWQDLAKLDRYYLCTSIALNFILPLLSVPQSIFQFFIALKLLNTAFLFIILVSLLHRDWKSSYIFYFICVEFLMSFTNYFSSFKDYLIYAFLVLLYRNPRLTSKQLFWIIPFLGSVFSIGVIWTGIKPEYRERITLGETVQANLIGPLKTFDILKELVTNYDLTKFQEDSESLMERVSYINYFSAAVSYVPLYQDHEDGRKLFNAYSYGFTPRILFPEKDILDDSEELNKYTGMSAQGLDEGVSISLGYMADAYIDFGNFLYVTPFIFGITTAFCLRVLFKEVKSDILRFGLTFPFFTILSVYGASSLKVIPPILYYTVVALMITRIFLRRWETRQFLHST